MTVQRQYLLLLLTPEKRSVCMFLLLVTYLNEFQEVNEAPRAYCKASESVVGVRLRMSNGGCSPLTICEFIFGV